MPLKLSAGSTDGDEEEEDEGEGKEDTPCNRLPEGSELYSGHSSQVHLQRRQRMMGDFLIVQKAGRGMRVKGTISQMPSKK